jgi:hypothetical protein
MKFNLALIPTLSICFFLISATSIKVKHAPLFNHNESTFASPLVANTFKESKLNFFNRTLIKLALKKYKQPYSNVDGEANSALMFGIAGLALLIIGLFVPLVIYASIPAAIVAWITGASALRNGTNEEGKAKTGKALGIATLISLLIIGVLVSIAIAGFLGSWG